MRVKETVQKIISRMPDQATLEDIQYELFVLESIQKGENDYETGNTLTQTQVEEKLGKWLK